jgi:UDP-N-acetylglucosamine 2-epimerase (non-hydrolysing)
MSVTNLDYLHPYPSAEPLPELARPSLGDRRKRVLTLFGTRPEVIKLAPVIAQLERCSEQFVTVNVTSAQHTDLLYPFIRRFGLRLDHNLQVMQTGQTPSQVCARVLGSLDPILDRTRPDLILVQGDTTTAMAGALAGFHRSIPVGHVEAGLRSGNDLSPFPEEMNRKLITRLAKYHFAATQRNRQTLLTEGVSDDRIFVTGNPVVDALESMMRDSSVPPEIGKLLESTEGCKRIVLTTHRREAMGGLMTENLRALAQFVARHEDVVLVFPVHPNPEVVRSAEQVFGRQSRIHRLAPLSYEHFIVLLRHSWLIVSDSGGVQEEAPTLRKPLMILRENTERPESVESGVARLVGGHPERLAAMLEETYSSGTWIDQVAHCQNPFGRGDAAKQIVDAIAGLLNVVPVAPVMMSAD